MKALLAVIRSEPAAIGAAVTAAVALVAAFGVHLSVDQTGAIAAVVAALTGLVVRAQVTPTVPAADLPKAP